ncbi:gamma carbonic anhydrase family protein [Desertivirga brevis]|uniref:gamma carbonic anhydrase family protein n=1 Tax=Desertivirga brevis TaxID=2810310 RepID=UPI001A964576|nr:gamma carbonic anhydrase family protein [Pedobacter sp. SYSU D00873]
MALVLPVKGISPVWGSNCFIAQNSTIVGNVRIGDNCSVWFNSVIRGDVNYIEIGNNVNIQDGVVIHCTYQRSGTTIHDNVSIGHNALVHGCTLKNNTLIGMGAIVMDNAVVEEFTIIAAGAIVLENTICETGHIYAGAPAKKIKPINEQQRSLLQQLPKNYIMYASCFTGEEAEL